MSDEDAVRLPRYAVGIDSYRAAKILIDKHGAGASAAASRRTQELMGLGDDEDAATWADILFAIGEMQRGLLSSETLN
jgi:hypothetical protein